MEDALEKSGKVAAVGADCLHAQLMEQESEADVGELKRRIMRVVEGRVVLLDLMSAAGPGGT